VRSGLASTSRVITAAAIIMISVFASFILNGDPVIKEFGVGLSVAILLDATLVRMIVVPASMALLGERNWYLPRWLAWLPRVELPES
jgi:RND superfamily putative drug exporter